MARDPRQGGRGPKGSKPGRKMPPPEQTGEEAKFLFQLRDKQTNVTVKLVDGRTFTGTIEYYDRYMIKVVPEEGPGFFIRKTDIRYMYPEEN